MQGPDPWMQPTQASSPSYSLTVSVVPVNVVVLIVVVVLVAEVPVVVVMVVVVIVVEVTVVFVAVETVVVVTVVDVIVVVLTVVVDTVVNVVAVLVVTVVTVVVETVVIVVEVAVVVKMQPYSNCGNFLLQVKGHHSSATTGLRPGVSGSQLALTDIVSQYVADVFHRLVRSTDAGTLLVHGPVVVVVTVVEVTVVVNAQP